VRKEIAPPVMIAVIAVVVVIVGVIGFFVFRSSAPSGPLPAAVQQQLKDPMSESKMGPNGKKGTPIPPNSGQ
jgi:flagellar basal body-associated protein FliL